MHEQRTERLNWLERMKEVQRIQYDYFKFLIGLCSGIMALIIAFIKEIFQRLDNSWLVIVSLACLAVCIIISLLSLQMASNVILYINGLQLSLIDDSPGDSETYNKKLDSSLNDMQLFSKIDIIFLGLGICAFLVLLFINFPNLHGQRGIY